MAAFAVVLLNPSPAALPPTYSQGLPALRVVGARLAGAAGQPIELVGVNRSGTEYSCAQGWGIFDGPVGSTEVSAMATWGIDAVRVPLNEDCWLGLNVPVRFSGAVYRQAIEAYVTRLTDRGLYAILDLHWSAPGTERALGQEPMPDTDHSVAFWSSVATTFRLDKDVLFELYNEPHGVSWDCWRSGCIMPGGWRAAGMQTLLDAVRTTGATQPVIVDGLDWANNVTGWLSHPLNDPLHQLVAGLHVYAWNPCVTTTCWEDEVLPLAEKVPVMATEFGETDCRDGFIDTFVGWAHAHDISTLAWAWNTDQGCLDLIENYASATPTAYGSAIRALFTAFRTG